MFEVFAEICMLGTNRQMNGRMDGRMDGRTDGWTNGWTNQRTESEFRAALQMFEI